MDDFFTSGNLKIIGEMQFLGNSVENMALAILIFIALFLFLYVFMKVLAGSLKKISDKKKIQFDNAVVKAITNTSCFFYLVVALYFSLRFLSLNAEVLKWIKGLLLVVIVYEAVRFLQVIIEYFVLRFYRNKKIDNFESTAVFIAIRMIIRVVLWTIGILLVLSNIGLNVTSLIASLGIGGVAMALAVQNVLGDVFSSFSLYFDRPFQVGDFIVVGDAMGTVKKIGLKTTRLEALDGEEIVISNKELTTAKVQNFKKMKKRRVKMELGVAQDTASDRLKKIHEYIEKIIKSVNDTEFARCHFRQFGGESLDFEIVYFVLSNDYDLYMDKQQEINFKIKELFEKEKIKLAFHK